jgi:Fibronectin type III domain
MTKKLILRLMLLSLFFTNLTVLPSHADTLNVSCVIGSATAGCEAYSPQELYLLYGTTTDGAYNLSVGGSSVSHYLLMNRSNSDSGGWILLMKGTKTSTAFNYDSTNFSSNSTTLNTGSTTNDVSTDAKFAGYNSLSVKKLLAVFKDPTAGTISAGGDLASNPFGGHVWMETLTSTATPYTTLNTTTAITTGTYTNTRYSIYRASNASNATQVFSYQEGVGYYGFNVSPCNGNGMRWGVEWNNEGDYGSCDVYLGIGFASSGVGDFVPWAGAIYGSQGTGVGKGKTGFQIWGKLTDPNLQSPRSLSITNNAGGNVTATWLPPASGTTTEYLLQYKPTSASDWSSATTHRVTSITATPSVTISGMSANTYNFRVFARDSNTAQTSATPVTSGNISVNLNSSFNSFGLSGGATTATYRSASTITADVTVASKVTFKSSGVVISGCKNKLASGSGSSYTVTCSWKPSLRGKVNISAVSTPVDGAISGASAPAVTIVVANRSGTR